MWLAESSLRGLVCMVGSGTKPPHGCSSHYHLLEMRHGPLDLKLPRNTVLLKVFFTCAAIAVHSDASRAIRSEVNCADVRHVHDSARMVAAGDTMK